jgi:hypothetical protein
MISLVWRFVFCPLDRHKSFRRDMWWNGDHYIGTCQYCGCAIRNDGPRRWRRILA